MTVLAEVREKDTRTGDFSYKFGQKWKISAKISGNKRGKTLFPKF